MESAMLSGRTQVGVIRADWSQLSATLKDPAEKRFLARLATARVGAPHFADAKPVTSASLASRNAVHELDAAPPEKRRGLLLQIVRSQVAGIIGFLPGEPVPEKMPLRDLGLDSLMSIELRIAPNRIANRTPFACDIGFRSPLGGCFDGIPGN